MKTFTTGPAFKNFRFSENSRFVWGELIFPNGWGVSVSRRAKPDGLGLWEAASTLAEGVLDLDNPVFNGELITSIKETDIEEILAEVFALAPLEQRPEQSEEE